MAILPKIEEIKSTLRFLLAEKKIILSDSFYFLPGREHLIPFRLKKEKIARDKWRRVLWIVSRLRIIPYIRLVLASGSLAINNTSELSDLDVMIVTKHGRIWLTRLFIYILLSLLGVRRKNFEKIAPDKFCANHYITDESLEIPYHSIYNAQTYVNLIPIYARDHDLFKKFREKNNWVSYFVYNWTNLNSNNKKLTLGFVGMIASVGEHLLNNRFGDWLEKLARKYQYQRIVKNPMTKQRGGRVVFNDDHLEFHPNSIEQEIITKHNERLVGLGLSNFAHEKNSGLN